MGRGERRCVGNGIPLFRRVTESFFTTEVTKCVAKLEDRRAAGADNRVN